MVLGAKKFRDIFRFGRPLYRRDWTLGTGQSIGIGTGGYIGVYESWEA